MNGNNIGLSETELDMPVYRIMKEEHVINMFAKNENVLSKISNWKDKFENFQMALGGVLDGKDFEYGFKDDFSGQCWTWHAHSEAMWGIYANDPSNPSQRYLRIRSTPRKLLTGLTTAHAEAAQDTCFIGKVLYKTENGLKRYLNSSEPFSISSAALATALLLKRLAFKHEKEVRLLYFGDSETYDAKGLYRYNVNPHTMITQIMADPSRDRSVWLKDRIRLKKDTGFTGEIKRSKMYDPPNWAKPNFKSKQ